eukprot:TRINITY_DN8873_c0_g1_i1.p3 TRINITY_DN8873_c0_g1~~TRINITY_DN8873_c0_g1_i1.p3  ORF type:complete len:100 (+),score=5.10 TRINITY_DN8873_c0_g1_i1:555-854(+)
MENKVLQRTIERSELLRKRNESLARTNSAVAHITKTPPNSRVLSRTVADPPGESSSSASAAQVVSPLDVESNRAQPLARTRARRATFAFPPSPPPSSGE